MHVLFDHKASVMDKHRRTGLNVLALADGPKISLMETSLVRMWEVRVALYGGVVVVLMDTH